MSTDRTGAKFTISLGDIFLTGETCPECGFDSIFAFLLIVNTTPQFRFGCGRKNVCEGPKGQ